jgi:hypothetical protein
MDINELKEVLGDKFEALSTHIADLTGQRDTARRESLTGRTTLKTELATAKETLAKMLEKAGVETMEEFEALPPGKATAEANRVIELQAKRLKTQLDEKTTAYTEIESRWKGANLNAALNSAVAKHHFIDAETAVALLKPRAEFVGDDVMYKTDAGDLIPIADAAATIAKAKPFLVQASGGSGSGAPSSARVGGIATMTRASFDALEPGAKMTAIKAGTKLV